MSYDQPIHGLDSDGNPKAWNTAAQGDSYGPGTPADYAGHTPADVGAVSPYPPLVGAAETESPYPLIERLQLDDGPGKNPGVFKGGQYPADTAVAAYTYPTYFDRLPEFAVQINHELALNGFPENEALTRQMLAMGEETGEFLGAVRRFYGMARRQGSWNEVLEEWADVIITAFVTANILGISRPQMEAALKTKLDKIFARGWHETIQDHVDTAQERLDFPVTE